MSTLIIAMLSDPAMYEEMLGSEHVDLNLTTKLFRSPLYVATECRRLDLIEHLLDQGADPHNYLGNGLTMVDLVVSYGWADVFQTFLDPEYVFGLSCARVGKLAETEVIANNFEIVEMILKKHDHECDVYGNPDLFAYACQDGRDAVVSNMLDHGADPNGRSSLVTVCPLVEAARNHLRTVTLLLDRGASLKYEDRCALVTALRVQEFMIVNLLLLDRGLTIDTLDLFATINSNNVPFAQSLLLRDHKIDWSPTEDLRLDHSIVGVVQNSRKEMMHWLVVECGLNVNNALIGPPLFFHAIRSASAAMVKCLLAIGATPIDYEALCSQWSHAYPILPHPKEELSLALNAKEKGGSLI
ncbi:ankyrin repeat-containing domain protein [Amylocarpus encephaloides]|uniref:Ankyrin repeat-containing domain protein n=1 Tax=Amylocarpus encephaloides TaxID=45428 RepID=A0A9P7YB17_9HELO|nr:ankyrin repeat-containing domain protein [Amylocarpus encephaloides]